MAYLVHPVGIADGDPGDNSIQEVTVVATSGTFTLEYDANGDGSIDASTERTGALAFNATVLQVQTALEGIVGADNVTVSANSNVYKVRFATSALAPGNPLMVANSTNLGPSLSNPSALVNLTLEITKGAAKNKLSTAKPPCNCFMVEALQSKPLLPQSMTRPRG